MTIGRLQFQFSPTVVSNTINDIVVFQVISDYEWA